MARRERWARVVVAMPIACLTVLVSLLVFSTHLHRRYSSLALLDKFGGEVMSQTFPLTPSKFVTVTTSSTSLPTTTTGTTSGTSLPSTTTTATTRGTSLPPTSNNTIQQEQIADYTITLQREAVENYCAKYDPHPSNHLYESAYGQHMLVDDTHSVVFCFLPKVGCTNLKLLFFVSQGLIPRSELLKPRDKINQGYLMNVVRKTSRAGLRRWHFSQEYFKYVMVRNPLARLTSAFRSKIERYNMTGRYWHTPHYNWARRSIYRSLHPVEYEQWKENGWKPPITISFSDFIDYWLDPNDSEFKYDDHFISWLKICQPCRTRFDFYGNFRHFERDAQVLIDKIGASSLDLRQGYYSEDTATDQRMKLYYSTLSDEQKRAVLRKMALELEFHYTIFPEERDSHKHILDIDTDIMHF